MSDISHQQAIQLIHRRLDGLLNESQLLSLEEHLRSCDECGTYASEMELLPLHLRHEFHTRWDKKPGPSQQVIEHVTTKARNIPVTNRISSGIKLFAGAMALILLGVAINFVVSRLQSTSTLTNATKTVGTLPLPQERLLAFASDQNGNFDIYTMHADGTNLTNLTNSLVNDTNPIWSPDGKYIAFESDRDGFVQIYRMDADGSNVVQLTREEADHRLPLNRNGTHNPWAPDGSRLLFLQEEAGKDMKTLYSIDINGENKIKLANGRISLYDVSWSPGGQHIAYLLDSSPTPDKYIPDIYAVEPDGSNDRELKKLLPTEKQSDFLYTYYWSSNGQSIFLNASATGSLREAIYQLDLQTNTFLNETETKLIVTDWREGGSLIQDVNQEGMPFVWERSDGTSNTFEASKAWDTTYDPSIASAAPCSLDVTRSTQNNFAFGVYCPDAKFNLYWTNSDGSIIKQLLTLPTDVDTGGVGEIAWSPDDQYMAFNLTSSDKTEMYVVNVEEFLASPSSQPLHVSVSNGKGTGIPSWQPVINEDLTKELPTPQPTLTSSLGGLLAFTSDQNGDFDIYTMHADGTDLTNLTNDPASDTNPKWSPDGRRIAFESNRDGVRQIYLMDADGSNVVQLTKGESDHAFLSDDNDFNPWSPDGSRLLVAEILQGEASWQLYAPDVNGEQQILPIDESPTLSAISWSPDGQHIALQANDPQNPDSNRLYIVNADGSDLREFTGSIRQNESFFFPSDYHWSPDGQSLFFVAFFLKSDYWTVYEARLVDNSLMERATTKQLMYGWWNDIYVINNASSSAPFEWVRPDGTSSRLNPDENCRYIDLYQSDDTAKRSPNGNWVVTGQCSNGDTWLYWANSDGTQIKRLLDSPIPITNTHLSPVSWSPDDQFTVFAANGSNESDLYILDVSEALNDPSIQPVKISKSFSPSWQPIVAENIVKEIPTPQSTSTSSSGGLIAFASEQNGNSEIYTMHADGSELTNITNSPAQDSNPIWSPDGKHIAFQSSRKSFTQIYLMEADGSNLIQLTNEKANHQLNLNLDGKSNPWSPDGSRLLFLQSSSGGEISHLYVMGIDGENKILLASGRFSLNSVSWSPDGKHIAYVLNEASNPTETFVTGIYVVDPDGNNSRELKNYVLQGENLGAPYYWLSDGRSIIFVASRKNAKQETIYEFNLDHDTLLKKNTLSGVVDWQNDVFLTWVKDFVWHRSDGSKNTLAWEDLSCLVDITRSSHGNFAIGAYCPDSHKFKFYWTNADGSTIKQLLDSSEPAMIGEIGDIVWSWDDQFVAFIIATNNTSLYILNIKDALKNPSVEPQKIVIGGHELLYALPSWQPAP